MILMKEYEPDAVFSESNIIEKATFDGINFSCVKEYGVGIDCHRSFIQVNVLFWNNGTILEKRKEFGTDWASLCEARDWAEGILRTCASPPADVSEGIHYVIESTSVYHICVLESWQGRPSVINPGLAGATKRKTDILDARQMSLQDLMGIWQESFIVPRGVLELRTLIWEREDLRKQASRCSMRINTGLLKLGITIGRDGSVTGRKDIRKTVEGMLDGTDGVPATVNPAGIPEDVRSMFSDEYGFYDMYIEKIKEYDKKIFEKASGMRWQTEKGAVGGKEMLGILESAPGIGRQTAVLWMATIVDASRFPNDKAIAAYCGCDPSLKVSAGKVTSTVRRKGNKGLHSALCRAAAVLVKNHSEPFGQWGYNIVASSGRWKKGVSAVARKLAVALYHMMLRGEEFSYDRYGILVEPEVIDITIDELLVLEPQFRRYVRPLHEAGINGTRQMVHEFYTCRLAKEKGLGKKFFVLVRVFIQNQSKYKKLYFKEGQDEKAGG